MPGVIGQQVGPGTYVTGVAGPGSGLQTVNGSSVVPGTGPLQEQLNALNSSVPGQISSWLNGLFDGSWIEQLIVLGIIALVVVVVVRKVI